MIRVSVAKKLHGQNGEFQFCADLTIDSPHLTSIFGPSGSGKSTLLRMIAGLERPDSGIIEINKEIWFDGDKGINLPPQKRGIGFVFQEYNLLDTLTLEENMALPLTIQGLGPEEIGLRVRKIADKLQIGDVLGKFPFQRAV